LSDRAVEAATSKSSSTRESVVLTDWPPGPLERLNRQLSSARGSDTEAVTGNESSTPHSISHDVPGPGTMCA
jgi:hypothetical protein